MKIVIIETREDDLEEQINDARLSGAICFVQVAVDPDQLLLRDKFLYYEFDDELYEKINLLNADITAGDMLRW